MDDCTLTGEEWWARSAHRSKIVARRDVRLLKEAPAPATDRVTLATARRPSPPEGISDCGRGADIDRLGEARPKERVATLAGQTR